MWLLYLLLIVLLTPLVLGIPIVWLTQRFRGEPKLDAVVLSDIGGLDMDYFDGMTVEFERLGFHRVGDCEFKLLASPRMFRRLLLSSDGHTVGVITAASTGRARQDVIEVASEWASGESLTTGNYHSGNAFRYRPGRRILALPRVQTVAALLEHHEQNLRRLAGAAELVTGDEDVHHAIISVAKHDLEDQVKYHRLRRTADGGFRFTLYGAIAGTFAQWWYTFFGRWLPRTRTRRPR